MGLFRSSAKGRAKAGVKANDWLLEHRPPSYWVVTRRPVPSLLLVTPVVAAYEAGVIWLAGTKPGDLRTGADMWMRKLLASIGVADHWLLPLLLVVVLLVWQVMSFRDWRCSPGILAGMLLESTVWAIMLIGISRLIDLAFSVLEHSQPPLAALGGGAERTRFGALVGYLGAGVYEETLFRLILVPVFWKLLRLLQAPQVLAITLAVTGSALLFALAHYAGSPGEAFTWFAFVFRWMAGVFFAWVFVLRGFGIAVGTHTMYDILVGWIAWRI
jgi:Type II CAAX prenyl endopeptidase Rce1-like